MEIMEKELEKGAVYLVGAGPGDPELITVKGMNCLRAADVIIYDYIVDKRILEFAKETAECINAGKSGEKHTMEQVEINALIVTKAKSKKSVVRLKGGDPFIFGRGAEEMRYVSEQGVKCYVVPGISSVTGVATMCGIPLTDREYASSISIMTGHKKGGANTDIVYADTMVFVMARGNLSVLINVMKQDGYDMTTPCAIIERGTWENEKRLYAKLSDIVDLAKKADIKSPAIFIVGKTVFLAGDE